MNIGANRNCGGNPSVSLRLTAPLTQGSLSRPEIAKVFWGALVGAPLTYSFNFAFPLLKNA